MRNEVDLSMKNHDFQFCDTGGGCTAYLHELENKDYILITVADDSFVPKQMNDPCLVGLYRDTEVMKMWDAGNVAEALHIAKYYVSEFYLENEEGNKARVERADHVLRLYAEIEGSEAYEDDAEALLTDLLADLMHWADANNHDFTDRLSMAITHHAAEVNGED
jgi:hypothetical protein